MRFVIQQQYIAEFVDRCINSFEDLLQFGRHTLQHIYENRDKSRKDERSAIDTATGVENSLYDTED